MLSLNKISCLYFYCAYTERQLVYIYTYICVYVFGYNILDTQVVPTWEEDSTEIARNLMMTDPGYLRGYIFNMH